MVLLLKHSNYYVSTFTYIHINYLLRALVAHKAVSTLTAIKNKKFEEQPMSVNYLAKFVALSSTILFHTTVEPPLMDTSHKWTLGNGQ